MKLIENNQLTKSLVWELPEEDVLIVRKYWVHHLSQALSAFMAILFALTLVLLDFTKEGAQITFSELGSVLGSYDFCLFLPFGFVR
jgi:hypothetical protein